MTIIPLNFNNIKIRNVFILLNNLYMGHIMSGFEINKIFASVILALIVIAIIGFLGNLIVNVDHAENQKTAYKIDIIESEVTTLSTKTDQDEIMGSILNLLRTASIENGEKIYKKCASCHNYKKDSASKIGPNLWNIINRPKGNKEGFAYSKALAEFGGKWTYEELSKFLYKPKDYISGTKMNFAGLKNAEDRANLLLWLRQLSDNPVPLPE